MRDENIAVAQSGATKIVFNFKKLLFNENVKYNHSVGGQLFRVT